MLVYLALRAIAMLRDLPRQAQRWREQQVERAAVAGVLDALSLQLSGRFVRAQAAALGALEQLKASPSVPVAQTRANADAGPLAGGRKCTVRCKTMTCVMSICKQRWTLLGDKQ